MPAESQRDFFEEHGYLVIDDLLSSDELDVCRSEIARLHVLAAELEAAGKPEARQFQREPHAETAHQDDGLPLLRKVEDTGQFSEPFRTLSMHDRLIPVIQQLIGPDLLLFRSTLMLKPAQHGSAHALHQDSAYWPMEPPTLVTVSIALNEATPENGCIQIIPGSHKWGLQEWGLITRADDAVTSRADIDVSKRIDVPLKAGSAVCFHSLMVHGSVANQSPHPRNTALYAYFSPAVRYAPKEGQPEQRSFPVIAGLDGQAEFTLTAS
jgi:phytanoyl-CoA hydroxylase